MAETQAIEINVYAILDLSVETHSLPFYEQGDIQAQRQFISLCSNPESALNAHHGDFQLWKIGSYDLKSGDHYNTDGRKLIMSATKAVEAAELARTRALQLAEAVRPAAEDN